MFRLSARVKVSRQTIQTELCIANKRLHSDKIKLRRFALQLYFSGEAKRYAGENGHEGVH